MTCLIAKGVADGQVGLMAVAALAQGLNVFQCRVERRNMQAAHPARHLAV